MEKVLDINIRKAVMEDVSFLADVVVKATIAQGRFGSDFDEAEYRAGFEEWTRETLAGKEPECILSVIEYDNHPVGRFRVLRNEKDIMLAGIQLLPEYQNKGIGTYLVEQLKQEAEQMGIPLLLNVAKDNPNAQRLYERLGFSLIGQDEKEYHMEYQSS